MRSGGRSAEGFRTWLVKRVMGTRAATQEIDDVELDGLAREMGIMPDVLLEARLNALRERVAAGKSPSMGKKKAGSKHYQYELLFPEVVFAAWKQEAERRGLDGSALLRSMIHAYLSGSHEPREILKKWVWRGIGYPVHPGEWRKNTGSRYPFRERCLLSSGAKRALERRAGRMGCTPSAIVRGLVLAVIDGNWGAPGTIDIVDASTMHDDEDRYFLG